MISKSILTKLLGLSDHTLSRNPYIHRLEIRYFNNL